MRTKKEQRRVRLVSRESGAAQLESSLLLLVALLAAAALISTGDGVGRVFCEEAGSELTLAGTIDDDRHLFNIESRKCEIPPPRNIIILGSGGLGGLSILSGHSGSGGGIFLWGGGFSS